MAALQMMDLKSSEDDERAWMKLKQTKVASEPEFDQITSFQIAPERAKNLLRHRIHVFQRIKPSGVELGLTKLALKSNINQI